MLTTADLPPIDEPETNGESGPIAAPAGFWRRAWRQFRRRKLAMAALTFVVALTMVAVAAPIIVGTRPVVTRYKGELYFPFLWYYNRSWENPIFSKDRFRGNFVQNLAANDPDSWALWPLVYQDPYRRLRNEMVWPGEPENPTNGPPSRYNWFGTNSQGFDVFASMVHGAQTAVSVGFVSMSIAATIGITIGALAGYFGRWVDIVLSRVIEVVMCVPTLVLILALVALLDKVTNFHLMVIVGCTAWTGIARLTRAEFLKLKQMEYISAARAMGASSARLMFTHILRNALAPVLVPITFGIADAILIESGLSYLGFGASPPNPSWGTLLSAGRGSIETTWWLIVFPGAAIFLTVLAYNLIGEGLQEATDPRLRQDAH
jgi:peptide/nickel transport system permease protein